MGIIDDHYGGYENLALYSDGHGGFDMEAAYGTTFESTIDARIQAVCDGTFPIGSDCGFYDSQDYASDQDDLNEEDNPLVDVVRAFLTTTKIKVVNEKYEAIADRVNGSPKDRTEWLAEQAAQVADAILRHEGYSSWEAYCQDSKMQQRRDAAEKHQLAGLPEDNALWWLWHNWGPSAEEMATLLMKLAGDTFQLALRLQRSMILAHTSAEAQLSWQGLLYTQLCEVNKKPINNVSLKQIVRFIQGLTAALSRSSNCSSVLKDDPVAASSKDGQAAQLLAGMLAGALTHRQNMRVTPRERDLTHLVDLIQSQLCKSQPDRALQLLGLVQYVHVSDSADDWMEEVMMNGLDHDIFGCSAGGYGVGRLLHHMSCKMGWDRTATANAVAKVHLVDSVFSDRNDLVDDCHLMACFDTEGRYQYDSFPGSALEHIRLGELFRGLTETWDCTRAAELLHMVVPVSVRAEPRHWACALLCIASHGWQKDHTMDGWTRACNILTEFHKLRPIPVKDLKFVLQWVWDGLPGLEGHHEMWADEWEEPSQALLQQHLTSKLKDLKA